MTDYNDGKWHGWNGGDCPVHPETLVDLRWVDTTQRGDDNVRAGGTIEAGIRAFWNWPNVAAFRVVKEYREPREWWVTICGGYTHAHATKAAAETYRNSNSNLAVEVLHVREVLE